MWDGTPRLQDCCSNFWDDTVKALRLVYLIPIMVPWMFEHHRLQDECLCVHGSSSLSGFLRRVVVASPAAATPGVV